MILQNLAEITTKNRPDNCWLSVRQWPSFFGELSERLMEAPMKPILFLSLLFCINFNSLAMSFTHTSLPFSWSFGTIHPESIADSDQLERLMGVVVQEIESESSNSESIKILNQPF